MSAEINEICARLQTGELEMAYARYDEATGLFYCTLKPRGRMIPGIPEIPNSLAQALSLSRSNPHSEAK